MLTGDKVETAVNISFSSGHLKPNSQQLYLTEHTTPETCLQRLDMHRLIILHVVHCSAIQCPSYCNTVVTAINHTVQYLCTFSLLNLRLCTGSLLNVVKFSENVWENLSLYSCLTTRQKYWFTMWRLAKGSRPL